MRSTKPKRRDEPSPNGDDGRRPDGRFGIGNKLGRGNPYAQRTAALRSALLHEITPADVQKIVRKMIRRAIAGDVRCAREVLNRCCGKPIATDTREPLDLMTAADQVLAARMIAYRRLALAHARGENLDTTPGDDARYLDRDLVEADPPHERRRLLKEVESSQEATDA